MDNASRAVSRADYIRTTFLIWLYRRNMQGDRVRNADRFESEEDLHFEGQPVSADEIHHAITYLHDKQLIEGQSHYAAAPWILRRPWLTAHGVDCLEKGQSVSEFLHPDDPVSSITVHVTDSQGVIIGGTYMTSLCTTPKGWIRHGSSTSRG